MLVLIKSNQVLVVSLPHKVKMPYLHSCDQQDQSYIMQFYSGYCKWECVWYSAAIVPSEVPVFQLVIAPQI